MESCLTAALNLLEPSQMTALVLVLVVFVRRVWKDSRRFGSPFLPVEKRFPERYWELTRLNHDLEQLLAPTEFRHDFLGQ